MKYFLLFALMLTFSNICIADKKIIYKYKEYEKFDLGDMEIKGDIIAPGDLSVRERSRKKFNETLFKRNDFDQNTINDIKFMR